MDDLLIDEMERTNCPGTALGIVDQGELVFTRNYGTTDLDHNTAVTSDNLFCAASVTKSFICAGILKLQEVGKLSVHDEIAEYLPITIGFDDDPITIHHLMTHSSGIPNLADSLWAKNKEAMWGLDAAVPRIPFSSWDDGFRYLNGAQEFLSRPGRRFHYNNFGYGILSKLITEVSGVSFKQYLADQLFGPLEMNHSGFYSQVKDNGRLSKIYADKPGSEVRELISPSFDDIRLTNSLDEAAGGLFTSITDLSHYLIMHLQGGSYNGKQVLSSESVAAMQERQFEESYPNASFSGMYGQSISGYGYGFAIDENFHGTKLIQHSGSFIGASAWFSMLPEHQRGVIMLSNHHPSPRIFAQAILMESMGLDCQTSWPLLQLRNHHEKLQGEYQSYKGVSKIKIISSGGSLYLANSQGENRVQLLPYDNDVLTHNYFHYTEMGGKMPVQFIDDGDTLWLHLERNKWKKQ